MSENKKKGHPNVAASEQPTEKEMPGQTNPDSANILPQTDVKYNGFVAQVLLRGANNATTGGELVRMLKLNGLRELTLLVERARREGVPICASVNSHNPGYYLADSADELEAYINSLDRRIKNVRLTRLYCMRTLREMGR